MDGFAQFSDLVIQAYGPDYTLSIAFEGRTVVSNVITASFEVLKGVESLQLLTTPTGTTNKAGIAFNLQPQSPIRLCLQPPELPSSKQ